MDTRVAVVAHRGKTLGGGLEELRRCLADGGVDDPLWFEVNKSRKAPKRVRQAVKEGADLVVAWGGDGMVQRCADVLAGTGVALGIIPAGTGNLFASNLGLPKDLRGAVTVALGGARRPIDLGKVAGEHFANMAGVGFDADMIAEADKGAKARLGRVAYLRAAVSAMRGRPTGTRVTVDGQPWYHGQASCVLIGNMGRITAGIPLFDDAKPDDGWLDVGVATASNPVQWARTLGRMVVGRSERSPFIQVTRGRKIGIRLASPLRYELDGGDRGSVTELTVKVVPGALTVCVPG
ncbi:MAG TPA: diacylglycerol kinase family protein [Mycobacteriales bacterium]